MSPRRPSRLTMIRALKRDEKLLRWAASLLVVPGWVRIRLLNRANELAAILERIDRKP